MLDPLSDVLRTVRLSGGVFLDVRMTAPWSVISQVTADDCGAVLANPAQLISFHVVLEGEMQLDVEGWATTTVKDGEIVLLPRNDAHRIGSDQGIEPVPGRTLVQPSPSGGLARVVHGGGGKPTHMVCGFLGSEDDANPVLTSLPRVLKLDLREGTARAWIESSVRFAASELADGRLASSSVVSRLSEVLLIEAVRHYASTLHEADVGWMKGLADPKIGRALAVIHGDLAKPWSAEELAREVAMSRSAFVERFTALVGVPPIRYLTQSRMQSAKLQLRETRKSIAQIAPTVGYESEEAFSRAFKRECGASPARWREQGSDLADRRRPSAP